MKRINYLYILLIGSVLFSCQENHSDENGTEEHQVSVDTLTEDQQSVENESSIESEEERTFSSPIKFAKYVAKSFVDRDFNALMSFSNETILFSPYAYIDSNTVQELSIEKMTDLSEENILVWGVQDGTGDTLKLHLEDYFKRYVCDFNLVDTSIVSYEKVEKPTQRGNEMHNLHAFFSDYSLVEIHKDATDDMGMNWRTLILVIGSNEDHYSLLGVIHNEWTI